MSVAKVDLNTTEPLGGCHGKCATLLAASPEEHYEHDEIVRQLGSSDLTEVAEAIFTIGAALTSERFGVPDPNDLPIFVQQHNWPDPVTVQQLAEGVRNVYSHARDFERGIQRDIRGAA